MLFSGTIDSNIKYGKEDADVNEVLAALDCAQATEFVSELPNGVESSIAQGGSNVSGGQKQRLCHCPCAREKKSAGVYFR